MDQVKCHICGTKCVKSVKTKTGSQRCFCRECKLSLTHKIDNNSKELQIFLGWLVGKESQSGMPGEARTFRRKISKICPIPQDIQVMEERLGAINKLKM